MARCSNITYANFRFPVSISIVHTISVFVFNKNDEEGLPIQMHLEEKNARIVGWVGRWFENVAADLSCL